MSVLACLHECVCVKLLIDHPDPFLPLLQFASMGLRRLRSVEWIVFLFLLLRVDLMLAFNTGQTTVNKKAPIHYIKPINDMVHNRL